MDFSLIELDDDQSRFHDEVKTFLDGVITEDVHENQRVNGDSFDEKVHLGLGSKGWLMPTWPVAEGGAGLDKLRNRLLHLEIERRRFHDIAIGTTDLVWMSVAQFSPPDLVAELKPKVAAGTVRFCLGYTEPDGGSDIAAAKVRSIRDGDEWLINGSKIFTTVAHKCQYTLLVTRSDPDLPKHKGITLFLVPLDSPGVEIQGIRTFGGERTNVVYYDDVRLSDRYRVGGVNDGWSVLHAPLDQEHSVGLSSDGLADLSVGRNYLRSLEFALDTAFTWADTGERPDGSRPIDDPSVQLELGRIAADLEAGICAPGPMGRVLGSDVLTDGSARLLDLVGPAGLLQHGQDGALDDGNIDFSHRFAQGAATYGGTVEVFRNIVAQHVLGLPRQNYPGSRVFLQRKATAGK